MEIQAPKPFNPDKSNIASEWQIWKQEFLIYVRLSEGYTLYNEEERALLLLNIMGTKAIEALEQVTFDDPNEKNDMDILIMKFDQLYNPPTNEVTERYKFLTTKLENNQCIDKYVAELKTKAVNCNFGNHIEKIIIDMIIRNVDKYFRQLVFSTKDDLSLEDIVKMYKNYTTSGKQINNIIRANNNNNRSRNSNSNRTKYSAAPPEAQVKKQRELDDFPKERPTTHTNARYLNDRRVCSKCGTTHAYKQCPAFNEFCKHCGQKGHYTSKCLSISEPEQHSSDQPKDVYNKYQDSPKERPARDTNARYLNDRRVCSKCGTTHAYKQCPAFNEFCKHCGQKGHYTSKCLSISEPEQHSSDHPKDVYNKNQDSSKERPARDTNARYLNDRRVCSNCGTTHACKQCPVSNEFCEHCGKKGHYTSKCLSISEPVQHSSVHPEDVYNKNQDSPKERPTTHRNTLMFNNIASSLDNYRNFIDQQTIPQRKPSTSYRKKEKSSDCTIS